MNSVSSSCVVVIHGECARKAIRMMEIDHPQQGYIIMNIIIIYIIIVISLRDIRLLSCWIGFNVALNWLFS